VDSVDSEVGVHGDDGGIVRPFGQADQAGVGQRHGHVLVFPHQGGQPPDVVEARFVGASRELRLRNWYELVEHVAEAPGGRPVSGLPEDPRGASYQAQLTQLHAMVAGKAHGLPDFETAWRVQQIIEEILT
jgi:hypothetical protein